MHSKLTFASKFIQVDVSGKQILYLPPFLTGLKIPNKPPRPQLQDTFGIGYRRVPVLAIGNDVYCDTYLIGDALEQAFPASQGYTTLYPKGKNGTDPDPVLIKTFFHYWADVNLFPHGAGLVPWEKVTDIQADRLGVSVWNYRAR
jgi:hypothetical protein